MGGVQRPQDAVDVVAGVVGLRQEHRPDGGVAGGDPGRRFSGGGGLHPGEVQAAPALGQGEVAVGGEGYGKGLRGAGGDQQLSRGGEGGGLVAVKGVAVAIREPELGEQHLVEALFPQLRRHPHQIGLGAAGGGVQPVAALVVHPHAIKKGHTLTNVINLIVSLGTLALIAICITKMISTAGKRDTNDELTQQTTAKVNQTFITFLFTIACLFISVMTLFSDILGRFKVTLNEYVITGLIWFCYAVYNFIGLYFESKFDDDEN